MRSASARQWPLILATLLQTACNAVLGIDRPVAAADGGASHPGTGIRTDGGNDAGGELTWEAGTVSDAQIPPDPHAWASWPMPNPAASALGTPSSYSLGTPGIVSDDVTGLAWQQPTNAQTHTWSEAQTYCEALKVAGGHFRLPSRIELLSIIDYTQTNGLDSLYFPDTPAGQFWTVSPFAGAPGTVWTVNFAFGTAFVLPAEVSQKHYVRCVR